MLKIQLNPHYLTKHFVIDGLFLRTVFFIINLLLVNVSIHAAQLIPGDVIVADRSVGLVQVQPLTGIRTVVSDFSNPSQGELGLGPFNLAVDPSKNILVVDPQVNKLFRVNPATGQRTVVSDFSDPTQGPIPDSAAQDGVLGIAIEGSGQILVTAKGAGSPDSGGSVFRDAILRINPVTGKRTLLSDFGDPKQGTLGGQCSFGIAIETSGKILVTDYNNIANSGGGILFRIDPVTGQRTVLSDFGNPLQGDVAQFPSGIAIESSGKILVVAPFFRGTFPGGALFRIDPVSGQRFLLSDFENTAQGATGTLLRDVTVESSGNILVADQDIDDFGAGAGAIFRVHPATGQRNVLSDFGDSAQGLGQAPSGVVVIPSAILSSFTLFNTRLILAGNINGYLIEEGTFTLGKTSNGIKPENETMTLTLSDKDGTVFSQTLPKNTFKRIGKSVFSFRAANDARGIRMMTINPTKKANQYNFTLIGNKINLTRANKPPVSVSLKIGDDYGSVTIPCSRISTLLICR